MSDNDEELAKAGGNHISRGISVVVGGRHGADWHGAGARDATNTGGSGGGIERIGNGSLSVSCNNYLKSMQLWGSHSQYNGCRNAPHGANSTQNRRKFFDLVRKMHDAQIN